MPTPPPSQITRQELIDELRLLPFPYNGKIGEVEFLESVFGVDHLPSTDYRCPTMSSDITQHRVQFKDWQDDWIYSDARLNLRDWRLLKKFIERLLHPVVRTNVTEIALLVDLFNRHFARDGWEVRPEGQVQSRSLYRVMPKTTHPPILANDRKLVELGPHIAAQVQRAMTNFEADPAVAVGVAKELVESVCKEVLRKKGRPLPPDTTALTGLAKQALNAAREGCVELEGVAGEHARKLLAMLNGLVGQIAEKRNAVGTGHGKEADAPAPTPLQAQLAIDSAAAFCREPSRTRGWRARVEGRDPERRADPG